MATLTVPSRSVRAWSVRAWSVRAWSVRAWSVRAWSVRAWSGGGFGRAGRPLPPLVVDQLGQPADLAFHRVETVLLQFERVPVQALPGARERRPQAVPALLDPAPAALQDAQPDIRVGLGEEREVHAERVVVVRLRAGLGEQLGQPLLALDGQPVDHLAAAAGQRRRGSGRIRRLFGDPAGLAHPAQRGIERAVGEGPEGAEDRPEPGTQLVPVHRRLVQQAEYGELQHQVALSCRSPLR